MEGGLGFHATRIITCTQLLDIDNYKYIYGKKNVTVGKLYSKMCGCQKFIQSVRTSGCLSGCPSVHRSIDLSNCGW
jgi:hypothetical protein